MAVYVVTWNINKERANYNQARDAFIKELETFENKKDSGLETVRFISTGSTAQAVSDKLQKKLDSNDKLFVSQINNGQYYGWLNKDVWDWISSRL